MSFTKANQPATLPERPVGWRKRMTIHINFGRAKGGSYEWIDPAGNVSPIVEVYRVRDKDPVQELRRAPAPQ